MMHLAEINIARLLHPIEHPAVADFANALTTVNGIAERSDGFVWRDTSDIATITDPRIAKAGNIIYTLSVWRDAASLEAFVWGTLHKRFYQRRQEWFGAFGSMHFAMWWVVPGTMPDVCDALDRLDRLQADGPSEVAFGWADLPQALDWQHAAEHGA